MPNLRNDYTEGVGKSVLELFKKVFQIKKEHAEKELEKSQIKPQEGGVVPSSPVQSTTTAQPAVEPAEELESGHVKLTNVSQYYDGTIYEGILNYDKDYDILFNIKDRTKGHFSPSSPTPN